MRKESRFQAELIAELKVRFPGCVVLKNDAGYLQGFPDLLVLHGDKWGALEAKRDGRAGKRPNQEYWVKALGLMSFAAFIHPENKQEVLDGLQQTFSAGGPARVS